MILIVKGLSYFLVVPIDNLIVALQYIPGAGKFIQGANGKLARFGPEDAAANIWELANIAEPKFCWNH